jgi:Late embryogenesis abundant protein
LEIQFSIHNTTPLSGTIQNVSYDLYADGKFVGSGVVDQPVEIPARSTTSAVTDFFLGPSESAMGLWSYFFDQGQVRWLAQGNAIVNQSLFGSIHVGFTCESSPNIGSISCNYTAD